MDLTEKLRIADRRKENKARKAYVGRINTLVARSFGPFVRGHYGLYNPKRMLHISNIESDPSRLGFIGKYKPPKTIAFILYAPLAALVSEELLTMALFLKLMGKFTSQDGSELVVPYRNQRKAEKYAALYQENRLGTAKVHVVDDTVNLRRL